MPRGKGGVGPQLAQIEQNFIREKPEQVPATLQDWMHDQAERFGIEPRLVEAFLASRITLNTRLLEEKKRTEAQKMAELIGVGQIETLQAFKRCLNAKKKRPVPVKGGLLRDEQGNIVFVETEDYPVQLATARSLAELHGMNAPKKVEIEHGLSDDLQKLTEAELALRLEESRRDTDRLLKAVTIEVKAVQEEHEERVTAAAQGAGSPAARTAIPSRDGRHLLLADGVDENQGRTGP